MAVIEGYAATFDEPYTLYDAYGPYREVIKPGAFDATLADDPAVILRVNHGGLPMASTSTGTLRVGVDDQGLWYRGVVDEGRQDVRDMLSALGSGALAESSFIIRIKDYEWSSAMDELHVTEIGLERSDVGPVTFGANPNTTSKIYDSKGDTDAETDLTPLDEALLVDLETA